MNIIITAPSLDLNHNVSGISSVTQFIIEKNPTHHYIHFEIGKRDQAGRGISRLLNILKSYFNWFFLLIKTSDKLVHFNLPLDGRSVIRDCPMIMLSKLMGVKTIVHVHGGAYILNPNIPGWAKFLLEYSLGGPQPKIVLGEIEKEFLMNTFNCENVQVLPNSLNLDEASIFERAFAEETPLKFLFLGRLSKDKGLEYIYQAFKTLKEENAYTPIFYLAGKGEDETEYIQKFSELLGESFSFAGVVSGSKKIDLLKVANVFVLPSFFEGLPVSLLEAMAFSQVPIVTNVGSIKYVVEDNKNGLFVKVKNSEAIVNAVLSIQSNPTKRSELAKAARETVFEKFNPDDYIAKLNTIYGYE